MSAVIFQGQITCRCKVPVQAPTSPQTCPVALWICPPAAMARWVVTIMPSLPPRACQLKAKWTWPKANPWETMGLGQTWTCSPIKVKQLISFWWQWCAFSPASLVLAAHHIDFHKLCTACMGFLSSRVWEVNSVGVLQAPWCTSSLLPSSTTCPLAVVDSTTKDNRTQWAWWARLTKGTMWWGRGQCRLTDLHSKVYPSECVCPVCKLWVLVFFFSLTLPPAFLTIVPLNFLYFHFCSPQTSWWLKMWPKASNHKISQVNKRELSNKN